jgi:hypothetical protein
MSGEIELKRGAPLITFQADDRAGESARVGPASTPPTRPTASEESRSITPTRSFGSKLFGHLARLTEIAHVKTPNGSAARASTTPSMPAGSDEASAQAPIEGAGSTSAEQAPAARGTVRSRAAQLLDISKVPRKPAVKVDGWNEQTSLEICRGWHENLVVADDVSIPQLSRLVALNFERAHADKISDEMKDRRLLPEGSGNDAYYGEMIKTFLNVIGVEDRAEVDKILDSFKATGTGGLHRQRVTISSLVNNGLSIAQSAGAMHATAKVLLSTAQLVVTLVSSKLAFDSPKLRFRNAGTEEIMPLGRADAAPSAKIGRNVVGAAASSMLHLNKIKGDVKRIEAALRRLDELDRREAPAAGPEQRAAEADLAKAYAKFCLRAEIKQDYKTASESAKIEFHGNERFLYTSYINGVTNLVATAMSIFLPAAVASHGVAAGALGLAAALYIGYQLSPGPSKDGEAKAKRAIVALSKSLDLLGGNARTQQRLRADTYRAFVIEKRAAKRNPEARAAAETNLQRRLAEIARNDSTEHDLNPLQNWRDYADYRQLAAEIERNPEALGAAPVDEAAANDRQRAEQLEGNAETPQDPIIQDALNELEAAFTHTHKDKFNTSTVIDAWKTPHRMRFDSMDRLLVGKVSESAHSLLKFKAEPRKLRRADAPPQKVMLNARQTQLKSALRDWVNFAFARSRLQEAAKLADDQEARLPAILRSAARPLAAVSNPDAQLLFAGDARQQVEATKLAKKLAAGEEERYTTTGGGAAALGALVNTTGGAYGLGVGFARVVEASHGQELVTHYGDQKDGQLLTQGSAPFTSHYLSGERARFQKTSMAKLLGTLKREGDTVALKLVLAPPPSGVFSPDDLNDALDRLVNQIETDADIPDKIELSIGGKKIDTAKLNSTTPYYSWRYDEAPTRTKLRFQRRQMRMYAESAALSVVSPLAQAGAQIPLATSRKAHQRGNEMSFDVREKLSELSRPPKLPELPEFQKLSALPEVLALIRPPDSD